MASQRTKLVTTERYPTDLNIKGSFVKHLITSILFFQLGNTDISVEKIAYEDGTTKCRSVM